MNSVTAACKKLPYRVQHRYIQLPEELIKPTIKSFHDLIITDDICRPVTYKQQKKLWTYKATSQYLEHRSSISTRTINWSDLTIKFAATVMKNIHAKFRKDRSPSYCSTSILMTSTDKPRRVRYAAKDSTPEVISFSAPMPERRQSGLLTKRT